MPTARDNDGSLSGPDVSRAELLDATPPELRDVFPAYDWNVDRLWELSLPVQDVPVENLTWLLHLPLWRWEGQRFVLSPAAVLADPKTYRAHHDKALAADLEYPIHITLHNSRWVILDGYHRLLKALLLGHKSIRGMSVAERDLR